MKTTPIEIAETINACAAGSYQGSLLDGGENWSGSSLLGRARQWAARYAGSREALLGQINAELPAEWLAETDLIAVPVYVKGHDNYQLRLVRELLIHGPDGEMYFHGPYYASTTRG